MLAEVAAEIAAAAGNADAETMSSHGGDGIDSESDDVPNGMSQSETVVVEISGVGGQTIRLSLPATSESENLTPTETMVSYDSIQDAALDGVWIDNSRRPCHVAERRFRVRRRQTLSYIFRTIISPMDDGSHIVQFDAMDKAPVAIHGWLGPSIETAAYFIIYPLRISSRLLTFEV